MTRMVLRLFAATAVFILIGQHAAAQPARQVPGTAALFKLAPQPPRTNPPQPNPRVRPAASQVGLESTDFYSKRGYPRVLGDAVEAGDVGGGASAAGQSGATGVSGASGAAGNVNGQGFQGNIGNQIGSNTGGTIFGGIFGGGGGGGGGALGGGILGGGFRAGMSGGGFTGATPKGFGFGGVPN